jgi:hypothetical protein
MKLRIVAAFLVVLAVPARGAAAGDLGIAQAAAPVIESDAGESGTAAASQEPPRRPDQADRRAIAMDSLRFLAVQHGARIAFRAHVREGLKGPFFEDYWHTLATKPDGFWDGDPWFTNFVGHSVQGSAVYRIARVNGASRHEAFWWGVLYSTQFELGPLGEAAIGNIAISPVDLVLTPAAGFALGLAEEWLAPRLPRRGERYWLITRPLLMGHVLARLIARR